VRIAVKRSGWLTFSGIVLIVAGLMRIFDSIWAFSYKGTTIDNLTNAIFGHSLKTYAWIWLIVGILLILSGMLILGGPSVAGDFARWFGVVVAGLEAVTAMSWMAYYPIWALTYVGVGVIVIYGLVAHYDEEPATS
jgi:hypothetical protein